MGGLPSYEPLPVVLRAPFMSSYAGTSSPSITIPGPMRDLFEPPAPVLSVSQLNQRVRALLENQFELLWVAGELSGVKKASSGHWYFCLKDANAQVECA